MHRAIVPNNSFFWIKYKVDTGNERRDLQQNLRWERFLENLAAHPMFRATRYSFRHENPGGVFGDAYIGSVSPNRDPEMLRAIMRFFGFECINLLAGLGSSADLPVFRRESLRGPVPEAKMLDEVVGGDAKDEEPVKGMEGLRI